MCADPLDSSVLLVPTSTWFSCLLKLGRDHYGESCVGCEQKGKAGGVGEESSRRRDEGAKER